MTSPLKTLAATTILLSLLIGCPERVTGMRYIPNSSNDTKIKHSDFLVNLAPQPSGLIPGLGWFLLPPNHKMPFHFYKNPIAAAAPTTSSYGIPSSFPPNSGYEASGPSSREDQVPPVPQP
ncbi:hypothetical protein Bca4012_022913 [Brassica carinata]|uniref:Uncharacterized protein n=1 Tax=Brassica carinata TaxID=52824 RepID=A0A8X7NXS6_BRACI|nr:hypothetical protein Bca52824_091340 [Brassica carinata]